MKLRVDTLSFSYEKGKEAISNISFDVDKGNIYCLLGKNASGKTTLLKCLNKTLTPDKGEVYVDGKKLSKINRRTIAQKIAFVPQEHRISLNYEVCDVLLMGRIPHLTMFSKPSLKDYRIALDNLERVGIKHLAYRSYNELSGGEKQLVLLARALTQEAEILLFDEPTSHLDFKHQHSIMSKIREIADDKKFSVILTMHDPNLAFKFCDYFIILKDGRIISKGSADEMLTEKNIGNIYDMRVVIKTTEDDTKIILPE
jgi:iron complex transport system ATP-binding protein